jgi:hypothetical protein
MMTSAMNSDSRSADSFLTRLHAPVDAASLAVFRIAFGAILCFEMLRYLASGWVWDVFVAPSFHFTYYGFEWVRPLPGPLMLALFVALALLAAMIAVGWRYRLAAALFWLGFSYIFLLEKAIYLNHFYLVALISFWLMWVPAAKEWSFDARRKPFAGKGRAKGKSSLANESPHSIPAWTLYLLRAQIAIPYFFGGIAKLDADWLRGQPMQLWMSRMPYPYFGEHWLALIFSYGGLLLDLFVVPLLLWRRTRPFAFAAAVAFHLCNALMFKIGIFPWFMIAATTLFFEPDWPRRLFRRLTPSKRRRRSVDAAYEVPASRNAVAAGSGLNDYLPALAAVILFLEMLLPFRHWLYRGPVDWTDEGYYFSWRMMLNDKVSALQLIAIDPASGQQTPLNPGHYLSPRQIDKMSHDPEMLREFAYFLGERSQIDEGRRFEIHAICFTSLNGRRPQLLVDPQVDLARRPRSLGHGDFVMPLKEPLPERAFALPPEQWAAEVDVRVEVKEEGPR